MSQPQDSMLAQGQLTHIMSRDEKEQRRKQAQELRRKVQEAETAKMEEEARQLNESAPYTHGMGSTMLLQVSSTQPSQQKTKVDLEKEALRTRLLEMEQKRKFGEATKQAEDEVRAATKMQAIFRGKKARSRCGAIRDDRKAALVQQQRQ